MPLQLCDCATTTECHRVRVRLCATEYDRVCDCVRLWLCSRFVLYHTFRDTKLLGYTLRTLVAYSFVDCVRLANSQLVASLYCEVADDNDTLAIRTSCELLVLCVSTTTTNLRYELSAK